MESEQPMRHHSLHATRLAHEHIGTIMTFVYSRRPLGQLVEDKFRGEWKYLWRALFEIPEERAERALLELGLYIRIIDDGEGRVLSSQLYGDRVAFGEIIGTDGSRTPLRIREVANKIIHAERYKWNVAADSGPTAVCIASQDECRKWSSASINLVALAAFCGQLMS
ncbi:MAG: hypothetical protein M0038_21075 [Pseudomonadota bacterium]|jgi:hypothetical protein|nr:hypothetical protein [Pseudomonadota bacterium]